MKTLIAVVGGEDPPPKLLDVAEEVGRRIAEAGATVVCGGRGGVMEATCRGAHRAGGLTIGILPGTDRSEANPEIDFAIPTGLGVARNPLVALAGDAVIAIDGAFGTLSEIAHALDIGKPVVALGSWNLDPSEIDPTRYLRVRTPAEAVGLALQVAAASQQRSGRDPFARSAKGRG